MTRARKPRNRTLGLGHWPWNVNNTTGVRKNGCKRQQLNVMDPVFSNHPGPTLGLRTPAQRALDMGWATGPKSHGILFMEDFS